MRFLADENLHGDLVAWLRSRGEDVLYVAETLPGAPDETVLHLARQEGRIVVTDDKDFGDLVLHRGLAAAGILLLRLRAQAVSTRIARLEKIWGSLEELLPARFVVVSDTAIRARPIGGSARG